MSQAQIGNLNVRLGIDTAQFSNGLRQAQGSLNGMVGALKGFAAAFAGSMIADSVVTAMRAVAEIGDVAETIGVSAEQLQAFNKMAIASGTSTDILTRGLQSIAEQSVDAGSKLGRLFEANNLVMKGKDTNQIIREFMDLVKNAGSEAEQLSIITGVLGDRVGRQLVEAFREGAAGADEATRRMIESGEYHSNAEVERLQKLETEYNRIMDRIATGWQQMVVGMLTAAQRIQQEWSSGKPSAASELWKWMTGQPVQDWDINTGQLIGVNTLGQGGPGPFNYPPSTGTRNRPVTVLPPSSSSSSGGCAKAPLLKREDIIEQGTLEDIYGAGEAIHSLAENFQEAQWGAGAFSDALTRVGSTISQAISDGLYGLITGTMSVKEAFASMAQSIIASLAEIAAELAASAALRMFLGALTGGGGAGFNIGGMVFGGLFANGGYLGSGKWGIAGEAGPEIIHGPARITPMDKMGGGQMNVTVINNTPAKVNTRRGPDGGLQVEIVEDMMANAFARGGNKIDQALQRGYGLRRAGR